MSGATIALVVGGGLLAVGGAALLLRKRQEAKDKCEDLATLDPRAAALCRFGGPVLDAIAGAAHSFVYGIDDAVETAFDTFNPFDHSDGPFICGVLSAAAKGGNKTAQQKLAEYVRTGVCH